MELYEFLGVSLVVLTAKTLSAMQETWVRFLTQEDLLEKEMATHSTVLTWKIPWSEEPGWLQSLGSQSLTIHTYVHSKLELYIPVFSP